MDFKALRQKYQEFIYRGYVWKISKNSLDIKFRFEISPDILFAPEINIVFNGEAKLESISKDVLDNLVFNLGLSEIPSYFKATCSKNIKVLAQEMTQNQVKWWEKFLITEMSQFYFENSIDFTQKDFIKILPKNITSGREVNIAQKTGSGACVAVGGGKDSALTLEIFDREGISYSAFSLNPTASTKRVIGKSSSKGFISVYRKIDPKLLELNKNGFLNGHTPIVSYMSFLAILVSYLCGFSEVVFSNEKSADEENTLYLGKKVNHQHDKTYEFEKSFREYNEEFLSDIVYFSFLRPIGDLKVAKMFAKQANKYHSSFLSCNIGQREDRWCGKCPKCLSTYMVIFPFLKDKTKKIFGSELYNDTSLKRLADSLITPGDEKPFECVATRKELQSAVVLSEGSKNLPLLTHLKDVVAKIGVNKKSALETLEEFSSKNFLPKKYQDILRKYI